MIKIDDVGAAATGSVAVAAVNAAGPPAFVGILLDEI